MINIKGSQENTIEEKANLIKEQLKNNDVNVETSANTQNGDGIMLKYYNQYYWIDIISNNIEKEQDVHGKNLLDIGEWKLVAGKDYWNNRNLESSAHFWERVDDHIRTGYNTHRFIIRYSNNVLINWLNYDKITFKFKLIKPGYNMTQFGLGYGKGLDISNYSAPNLRITNFGGVDKADVLYEKTMHFNNNNKPTIPTFVYWQNGVWYPGETCEIELYEIRLD